MLLRVPASVVIEEKNTGFVLAKSHARHLFSAPPPVTAALGSAAAPPVPDLRYLNLANSSTLSARKLCTSFCAASCCLCNPLSDNVKSERTRHAASKGACLRCAAASRSSCSMRALSCWRCTDRIPVIASSLVMAAIAEAGVGAGAEGVVASSAERDAASEAAEKLLAAAETADVTGDILPYGVNKRCVFGKKERKAMRHMSPASKRGL
jgi:hypothetical protein